MVLIFAMVAGFSFFPAAMAGTPNLTVNSQTTGGTALTGYWVSIADSSGVVVQTGFTPAQFTLAAGNYILSVGDYGGQYFDHWSDGTIARAHPVTVGPAGTIALTAIYSTTPGGAGGVGGGASGPSIVVGSQYSDSSALSGMYAILQENGATVGTGFTTATFPATAGHTYTVTVDDYTNAYFSHWSTGDTTRTITVTATSSPTTLTAVYTKTAGGASGGSGGGTGGSSSILVSSQMSGGGSLTGMYTILQQGSTTVATGFTPVSFGTTSGQSYVVTVDDYTNAYFYQWSDGLCSRSRPVTATASQTSLTAVFTATHQVPSNCAGGGPGTITVSAHRVPSPYWAPCFATVCSAGTGPGASMYFVLYDSAGTVVATGFADENGHTFSGLNPNATYLLYPVDCDSCHGSQHNVLFDHWGDGSTVRPKAVPATGVSLDAWYACTNTCA